MEQRLPGAGGQGSEGLLFNGSEFQLGKVK